jgi:Periplasmic protease
VIRSPLVRLLFVGAVAAACGCASWVVGPDKTSDRGRIFDALWTDFDIHYPFFEMKGVNWDSLGNVYRPRATRARSNYELYEVLGELLGHLWDPHVSMSRDGKTMNYPSPMYTTYFSEQVVFGRYVPENRTTRTGGMRYGRIGADIGYVWIPSFDNDGWGGEIDRVLADIGGVRGLIVDVRDNGGGAPDNALSIVERFADRKRTWGYVRFRNGPEHSDFTSYIAQTVAPGGSMHYAGPVVVLTNRAVYSAAEEFVLAMSALPQVTTMGDVTGGASAAPAVRELPNGWTYQMSTWIEYTLDQRPFEGEGLAPDILVRPKSWDPRRGIDEMLDAAVRRLTEGESEGQ